MPLDPELEGLQPELQKRPQRAPAPGPQLRRPAPEPVAPVPPEPEIEPQPVITPVAPSPQSPPRVLALLLAVLMIASGLMWLGRDVKNPGPPRPTPNAEAVQDEIVVDLVDDITPEQINVLARTAGIQLSYRNADAVKWRIMIAKVSPGSRAGILQVLRASKLVQAADVNYIRESFAKTWVPNDPMYSQQWHLKMLGLEEAWVYTKGAGAVVAVVDSGVGLPDPAVHRKPQDLAGTKFVKPKDYANNDDIPEDIIGHGTHVAGTIAESTNNNLMGAGVAPEATIMPIRVGGRQMTDDAIVYGIHWAADQGANVINMSLGGPAFSTVIEQAVQYAYQKGVVIIAAAGNSGQEGVNYPAKHRECIAVSSVGPDAQLAPYSTWGDEIDIAGPGGNLKQGAVAGVWQNTVREKPQSGPFRISKPELVEGFYSLQGTSMASPHVAGVAALLVSLGVRNPDEVRSILRKTAKPLGPANQYGAGLLNALEAVKGTGRNPNQQLIGYGILAAAALLVYFMAGKEQGLNAVLYFGAGFVVPIAIEKLFGFGASANLVGHSVVIPVIWLLTPNMARGALLKASSFTFGLALHFMLDVATGAAPFQVSPQSRIALWFYLNLLIAAYLIVSSLMKAGGGKPKIKKGKPVKRRPAYA